MEYGWHVFLANLDPVIGSEQGRTRPVLVISEEAINQILPVVNSLPITSRKTGRRIYPNEVFIPAGAGGLERATWYVADSLRRTGVESAKNKLSATRNVIYNLREVGIESIKHGWAKNVAIRAIEGVRDIGIENVEHADEAAANIWVICGSITNISKKEARDLSRFASVCLRQIGIKTN